MRMRAFAIRNAKELVRDPLSLIFGVGLPVALLFMMQMLRAGLGSVPVELFPMESFAPGMAVFGLSFLSLFLGMIVSNDRSSAFLMRLSASPMTGWDYVLGYLLPTLPVAAAQGIAVLGISALLGLPASWNIAPALLALIPVSALFSGLGMMLGTLLSGNQVGGAASILVQVTALLSGIWFDLSLMGGAFAKVCRALPFYHGVELVKQVLAGEWPGTLVHLVWVAGYSAAVLILAAMLFHRRRIAR